MKKWVQYDIHPAVASSLCLIPFVTIWLLGERKRVSRLILWLGDVGTRAPRKLTAAIFVLSFAYYLFTALYTHRALHPTWHDDQMHTVQVQLLATGKLWSAPHPMADFFDTFHIFVKPVYAPIHFPGTALLNVVGVWFHLPIWLIPMTLVSVACALAFHVSSKIVNPAFASLVPAIMWSSSSQWMLSTMMTSHNAMIFLGVVLLAVFLKWYSSESHKKCSVMLGAFGGLAAITRPVDAIAYAVPILIGVIAVAIVRQRFRLFLNTAGIVLISAAPFLFLQLIFDKGVTGDWLVPPYKLYNDIYHPYTTYGSTRLNFSGGAMPHVSDLAQKQVYYEDFMLSNAQRYTLNGPINSLFYHRLPVTLSNTLPDLLLYPFIVVGLFGLNTILRWVIVSPVFFFIAIYFPHIYYFPHYPPVVGCSIIVLLLIGIEQTAMILTGSRRRLFCDALWLITLSASVLSMRPLSSIHKQEYDDRIYRSVNFAQTVLPKVASLPALVFCQYHPESCNYHDEPVYNFRTASPDDSSIVMAQWLGSRNIELVRYYSELGQNRSVYKLDRGRMQLTYLGKVDEIIHLPTPQSIFQDQP